MPDVKKEDLKIRLEDDRLTLSGKTERSAEHEDGNVRYSERSFGSWSRTLRVPSTLKQEEIKAQHENGLLTVTMPNVPQQPSHRDINITFE